MATRHVVPLTEDELIVIEDALRNWDNGLNKVRFPIAEPWQWHGMTSANYRRALKRVINKVKK